MAVHKLVTGLKSALFILDEKLAKQELCYLNGMKLVHLVKILTKLTNLLRQTTLHQRYSLRKDFKYTYLGLSMANFGSSNALSKETLDIALDICETYFGGGQVTGGTGYKSQLLALEALRIQTLGKYL